VASTTTITVGEDGVKRQFEEQKKAILNRMFKLAGYENPERVKAAVDDNGEKLFADNIDPRMAKWRAVDHGRAMLRAHQIDCDYWDDGQIVGKAFLDNGAGEGGYQSTGSVPNLMLNVGNKIAVGGFWDANVSYDRVFTQMQTVKDFKDVSLINDSQVGYIDAIPQGEKPLVRKVSDSRTRVRIGRFGNTYSFTHETFVNDDLGRLATTLAKAGRGSRRTLNRECYAEVTGNPVMDEDNKVLFDNTRAYPNVITSGNGGAPSQTQVDTMNNLMTQQRDLDGKSILGIEPAFLVGPTSLNRAIKQLCGSQYDNLPDLFMAKNVYGDLEAIIEPELNANSQLIYYLFARQSESGVKYVFQGQDAPLVKSWVDLETDAVMMKLTLAWGTVAWNFRAFVQNAGQ
jgi:hypothetical protein